MVLQGIKLVHRVRAAYANVIKHNHRERERNFKGLRPLMGDATARRPTARVSI